MASVGGGSRWVHPCLRCGACCAAYRVSFYWAEAQDGGGTVPVDLTTQVAPHLRAMIGTATRPPRCVALRGAVGLTTHCAIYEARPSPCREFAASWDHGAHEPRCDQARARHGLRPLVPADFDRLEPPRAA
jgi:uncharacterized protein